MAKRGMDLLGAALGLLVLAPVFAVIAVAILRDSGRPVLFRQERVGLGGRRFKIFKFRTMQSSTEATGRLTVAHDARVTRAGAFLRRYKLDELPQLINVFLGYMSLVGPRPEVPEFVECYRPEDRRLILSVRPGMTDNASIVYRDESRLLRGADDAARVYREEILPRKIALYREYALNRSLWGDLLIILRTLRSIIADRLWDTTGR